MDIEKTLEHLFDSVYGASKKSGLCKDGGTGGFVVTVDVKAEFSNLEFAVDTTSEEFVKLVKAIKGGKA